MSGSANVTVDEVFTDTANYPDSDLINKFVYYLVGVGGSLMGVLGIVCNILSLNVLTTAEMRSTASLFLVSVAVYDVIYLLVNTVFVSMEYFHYGLTGLDDWHDAYVLVSYPFVNAFTNVAITGSVYSTVTMSIDRALCITMPLRWQKSSNNKRVKVTLVMVFILSSVLLVPMMMESRWTYTYNPKINQTVFTAVMTDFSKSHFYTRVYLRFIFPLFDSVIPVVAIATVNFIIVTTLYRQHKLRKVMSGKAGKDGETNRITALVMFISMQTLVTRSMRMVSNILMGYYNTLYINLCPLHCGVIAAFAYFFTIVTSTINCFCFCYFGTKFRKCFLKKYGCGAFIKGGISKSGSDSRMTTSSSLHRTTSGSCSRQVNKSTVSYQLSIEESETNNDSMKARRS